MESNVRSIRERGAEAGMRSEAGPALPSGGTCLLVAGATSSGKSTVLRSLIHQLFTDEMVRLEFRDEAGESIQDPVLQEWILEHDRGVFPKGTPLGRLQSYFIEFGRGRKPMSLSLCDMAGEDYQAILPQSGGQHGDTALDEGVEHILTSRGVKKLFVFTADATRKGEEGSKEDHLQPLYEDLLFSAILARIHALGVRRIRILIVATKWDAIAQKNQSARAFFRRKLPQTRSRLKQFARADVQYVRYSVGRVAAAADGQERIVKHDPMPARRLAQWIHTHGTGRTLKGYPKMRQTLWGWVKERVAT